MGMKTCGQFGNMHDSKATGENFHLAPVFGKRSFAVIEMETV